MWQCSIICCSSIFLQCVKIKLLFRCLWNHKNVFFFNFYFFYHFFFFFSPVWNFLCDLNDLGSASASQVRFIVHSTVNSTYLEILHCHLWISLITFKINSFVALLFFSCLIFQSFAIPQLSFSFVKQILALRFYFEN